MLCYTQNAKSEKNTADLKDYYLCISEKLIYLYLLSVCNVSEEVNLELLQASKSSSSLWMTYSEPDHQAYHDTSLIKRSDSCKKLIDYSW